VGDRQARAQRGAMTAVEREQLFRRAVAQCCGDAASNPLAGPSGSEAFTLEAQIGDLLERIGSPQARIELEAIDDPDRVAEPDMLRPQIAVAVDDAAFAHPTHQKIPASGEKATLDPIDPSDQPGRQA